MTIEELNANDIGSLACLQPPGWSNITQRFEFYTSADFCYPIKVVLNNRIIGIGSSIIHNDVAWLAHIIVHPEQRKKGLGTTITQALIKRARAEQCDTIYLCATELGELVYNKLGFETETEYLFFKGIERTDPSATNKVQPFEESMRAQLTDMDKTCSGEDRMGSLGEHLAKGYVYKNGHNIEGFFLPSIADGVIVATSDVAGVELMKFRLQNKADAAFPADNLVASKFMESIGMIPFKKQKRMRLGRKREIELSYLYNRVAGKIG